jgi:hypothetical protein
MPKVMVSVNEHTDRPEVVKLVRSVTGLSIKSVAERLAAGRSGWLLVADLYRGDHDERAEEFKRLVFGLRSLGVEPFVVRVSSHYQWSTVEGDLGAFSVSPESVFEMLDRQVLGD